VLGPRLDACFAAVERHLAAGNSAEAILGAVDALKYRSSKQIFGR